MLGPMITIELDSSLALELASMPVGTRLVVAFTVEDNALVIEVMAKADVLDGAFVVVVARTEDDAGRVDDEPLAPKKLLDDLLEVAADELFVEAVDRPRVDALKNDAGLVNFVTSVEEFESVLERVALEMVPVKDAFAVDDALEKMNGVNDDRLLDVLLGDCEVWGASHV